MDKTISVEELNIPISKDPQHAAWLKACYEHSRISKHPSTHTAALIIKDNEIILKGANLLPPGTPNNPEYYEGQNKHIYPNHAERDVVYSAAREGIATKGLSMVMPWLPCIPCAGAIISAGIKELIIHKQMVERTDERWVEELPLAAKFLHDAKVKIIAYDGLVGAKAYMHKQEWDA